MATIPVLNPKSDLVFTSWAGGSWQELGLQQELGLGFGSSGQEMMGVSPGPGGLIVPIPG